MAIYFVSDFHLGGDTDEVEFGKYELFCKFLDQVRADLTHLVILGDLYDFWFEYSSLIPKKHLGILFKLAELARSGIRVSYICGNHDFWIGDFMSVELGLEVVRDELVIPTPAGSIWAVHGDGLAPSDWKYRILKRVLRNKFNIAMYKLLPPSLAYGMARGVARLSRGHTGQRPKEKFLGEYIEYAKRKFTEGHRAFICGHIHWPELKQFDDHTYINTGDWITHFSYVKCGSDGFELLYMKQ